VRSALLLRQMSGASRTRPDTPQGKLVKSQRAAEKFLKMTEQFEYQQMMSKDPEVNEDQLNEMGAQGWLLVQVYQLPRNSMWLYIFARRKLQ
jgi:hypothetical protein